MKKLLMLAVSILTVATLAGVGVAGDAPAAAPQKASKKMAPAPKMTMGEVTAFTAGKSVELKDEKGKTHKFNISKKTKIEGDVKVGAKVDVTSSGRTAKEIKVAGGAEAPAEAPAAAAPAPKM